MVQYQAECNRHASLNFEEPPYGPFVNEKTTMQETTTAVTYSVQWHSCIPDRNRRRRFRDHRHRPRTVGLTLKQDCSVPSLPLLPLIGISSGYLLHYFPCPILKFITNFN